MTNNLVNLRINSYRDKNRISTRERYYLSAQGFTPDCTSSACD
ncbi:MAG: hypothetical protein AAF702_18255 [Chloroflexota bacterium]